MTENTLLPHIYLSDQSIALVAIVSLADALDRRKALAERGLPSEWISKFFPAVDMRNGKGGENGNMFIADQEAAREKYGRELRPPEIGCASSHIEVARTLSTSDFDLMLVLEDDVLPVIPNFLVELKCIGEELIHPAKRGAAFFCHVGSRFRPAMRRVMNNRKINFDSKIAKLYIHCDSDFDLWQSHAYFISKAAATRLCEAERRVKLLADDWSYKTKIGVFDQQFLCWPRIFSQDECAPSTIQMQSQSASNAIQSDMWTRILNSTKEGEFFSRACSSISYRFKSQFSHFLAIFPYIMK
jgi:GR25 family glycosyltransferase involved in LPS biosynthesis